MLKFVLDTNIISEPTKPSPSPLVLNKLAHHSRELCITAPTWHELRYGVLRLPTSLKRDRLTQYLERLIRDGLIILPYDDAAANWHSVERNRLTRIGKPPASGDAHIAAIAVVNGLALVTNNESDFQHFRELRIENWMK
jgi:tRNA(fMet)-specific endonuclease VapC